MNKYIKISLFGSLFLVSIVAFQNFGTLKKNDECLKLVSKKVYKKGTKSNIFLKQKCNDSNDKETDLSAMLNESHQSQKEAFDRFSASISKKAQKEIQK